MSSYLWRLSNVRKVAHAYPSGSSESACGASTLRVSEARDVESTEPRCQTCIDLVASDRRELGPHAAEPGTPWRRRAKP